MMGEQPADALSWREAPVEAAFDGLDEVVTDMCVWNKRRPDTKRLVRKPTRVKGSAGICQSLRAGGKQGRCTGDHVHQPIEGRIWVESRSMHTTEWAGGYTKEFAEAILEGAERELYEKGFHLEDMNHSGELQAVYHEDDQIEADAEMDELARVAEEGFQEADGGTNSRDEGRRT